MSEKEFQEKNQIESVKILLADDDSVVLELLTKLLSSKYNVLTASDGAEALKLIQQNLPDLILSDITMPKIDGLELCHTIKNTPETKDLPLILFTGSGDLEVQALRGGADDFIAKPIMFEVLLARIEIHLKLKYLLDKEKEEKSIMAKEIIDLQKEIIARLLHACEYKDEDTGNHLERISHYCQAIARAMEQSDEFCERIKITSPLHDIGKVGIPESILLKPGKLTPEEFKIIENHTIIGDKLLASKTKVNSDSQHLNKFLEEGRVIALTHHEKWDGSGYPQGLKGEEIPLEGRITAIADVFDALTSARPYKEAFPFDKAFSIIAEGRGKHFDPKIVDAFFKIKNQIIEIKSQFSNS